MNLRGQIIITLSACDGAQNWVLLSSIARQLRRVGLEELCAEIEAMEHAGLIWTQMQVTKHMGEARSRSELMLKFREQNND